MDNKIMFEDQLLDAEELLILGEAIEESIEAEENSEKGYNKHD